jgi:hypothetical protein
VERGLGRAPKNPQLLATAAELYDLQAHRFMEQERVDEARRAWERARSSCETLLSLGPDRKGAAARLAGILL